MTDSSSEFGGHEEFKVTPERLYALLTDFDALAGAIPDLVSAEKIDERNLKCVVRPGFSFLRGTMKLHLVVEDLDPPCSATMSVSAQGIGVAMRVLSHLVIRPASAGSTLDWSATISERKGLIAAVSPGLIKAAADQVIRHSWDAVRRQLGE